MSNEPTKHKQGSGEFPMHPLVDEPTKPALATDEMREKARTLIESRLNIKYDAGERWRINYTMPDGSVIGVVNSSSAGLSHAQIRGIVSDCAADFASQVLQQAEQRLAELEEERNRWRKLAEDNADEAGEYLIAKRAAARERDEARAQLNNGWIPVSERLPELERLVLITTNEGGTFTGKYREVNGKRFWLPTGNATYAANWKVTHWRPLPTPPGTKGAEPEWRKCPQCGRENSTITWSKNNGKCPNCNDLNDKD